MYVYVNGKIIPKEKAVVSLFDHGFLYGVGLFETFRIYDGHPFLLEDHLDRLNKGLEDLAIKKMFSKREVEEALAILLEKNNLQNAYIRFNVSAGEGELGLPVHPYENPNVIIYCKPLPPGGELQEKGLELVTLRRNTPEGEHRLKSHHFLNNIFAKREIGSSSDLEGVFLTAEGYLAEGVVSNLFWVKNETLYTPDVVTGILNGITRQFVIELARSLPLTVEEGIYQPSALAEANEIFITNSIQEIVAVTKWNGMDYPGTQGEITSILHEKYARYRFNLYSRNDL